MKLLLVDLPSILHPIWHMSGKEPDPDYASQQTVGRIHELASGFDGVAVCCDSPKSFRKGVDPNYKANRPERDERLIHQIKLAQEQLRADGFPVWSVEGYEADDVIASAVEWSVNTSNPDVPSNAEVVILSGDKDLLQLVDDLVTVRSPSGKTYGPVETTEKFVPPSQMRDYLILVGDSSDNVKGLPGIGDKKAKALLSAFGSIKAIYERIAAGKVLDAPFTPSIVTAFQEGIHTCELGRKLVTLVDDLQIPFDEILQPRKGEPMSTVDQQTGEVVEAPAVASGKLSTPPDEMRAAEPFTPTVLAPEVRQALVLAPANWNRELEPRSLQDAVKLAKFMYDSRLFAAYGTPQAVLSVVLAGRELGIGAMASLRGFHIIEGKPAMSAGLMAALILQSPKCKFFRCVYSDAKKATYRTVRAGDDGPSEASFTIEEAETAGLIKDKSGWKKYPADMLVSRAIARLARRVYPDICFGLYTPEELGREDLELEAA